MGKSSFTRVVDKNKDKRGESKLTAWEKRGAGDSNDGSPGELTRPPPLPLIRLKGGAGGAKILDGDERGKWKRSVKRCCSAEHYNCSHGHKFYCGNPI